MYAPRVRRLAMRYLPSPFDQEDATQEVFALLYRQREQIDPLRGDALPGFITTLARRKIIDVARSRGAQPAWESDDDALEAVPAGDDPERTATQKELVTLLEGFERKLKPAYRAFFRAAFVEGQDFDVAREALGIGALRARYLKRVLLGLLRRHAPLLEFLGREVRRR